MITPATLAGQDCHAPLSTEHGIADYNARRAYAYAVGEELALQRTISADAYLFLYKELVRLCKDRAFCWPGLDWLAQRHGTSIGTIKRWLDELVRAGLIQRKPRPGGLTTLTVIPALDAYDADQVPTETERSVEPVSVAPSIPTTPPLSPATPPLFFAPGQRITSDPSASTPAIRHTVKRQKIKSSVVECTDRKIQHGVPPAITNLVTEALLAAGLTDPTVIDELQEEPLHEIEAIIRYVARQKHIDNPPGLIVALARTKAGAALCRSSRLQPKVPSSALLIGRPVASNTPDSPRVDSEISAQIQAYLRNHIAPDVWAVWFSDLSLLDITESYLVWGVPNCLARDYIEREYMAALIGAGEAVLGRRIQVELVINAPV